MAGESVNGGGVPPYQTEHKPQAGGFASADDPNIGTQLDDTEITQQHQDTAVTLALRYLESALQAQGRIPDGVSILFCDDPTAWGVGLEALADIEEAGYQNAGYGQRAEGQGLFENAFRGYVQHGPLRFVCIIETRSDGNVRPLAFFDYFSVSEHLDQDYAAAAAQWERENPGVHPEIHIVSKLVADPRMGRDVVALPGLALAAVLQALADTSPDGIYVEAPAQPASQRFISRHLQRYILGLRLLLNQRIEGTGDGGSPSKMLAHIPPSHAGG